MFELRRAKAAASFVRIVRLLRWPGGGAAGAGPGLIAQRGADPVSGTITIALDAMGGDRAPEIVLRGADIALERYPGTHFLLFGAEDRISPLLAQLPRLASVSALHHTSEMIQNDDKP